MQIKYQALCIVLQVKNPRIVLIPEPRKQSFTLKCTIPQTGPRNDQLRVVLSCYGIVLKCMSLSPTVGFPPSHGFLTDFRKQKLLTGETKAGKVIRSDLKSVEPQLRSDTGRYLRGVPEPIGYLGILSMTHFPLYVLSLGFQL